MKDSVGKASLQVAKGHLSSSTKSGSLGTLSSAFLIAILEEASCNALKTANLISGHTSVGAKLDLKLIKPTTEGSNLVAISKITDLDQNGVHFEIDAFDEGGLVASAKHIRVFVQADEFERRCYEVARKSNLK